MGYDVPVLTKRALISLSQYFALLDRDWIELLFNKHGIETPEDEDRDPSRMALLNSIGDWLKRADAGRIENMLSEVVRTQGSFRNRVTPRYMYDGALEGCRFMPCVGRISYRRGRTYQDRTAYRWHSRPRG